MNSDDDTTPSSRSSLIPPSTPVKAKNAANTTIPPGNFYGGKQGAQPPPLPDRHKTPGSSRTAYIPPPSADADESKENTPFREPELIVEDPLPELIPSADAGAVQKWGDTDWSWGGAAPSADPDAGWGWVRATAGEKLTIDGRKQEEELAWWDPEVRARAARPGRGMLPTLLERELHDTDHPLYTVHAAQPELARRAKTPPLPATPSRPAVTPGSPAAPKSPAAPVTPSAPAAPVTSPSVPPTSASSAASASSSAPAVPPPSDDEVRTAIPHAHAYYCRREHGWVLIIWKSSSVIPPLARSYENSEQHRTHPLPDQARRKKNASCVGDAEQVFGAVNKTHHFHQYENAVDASKLNPPYRRGMWETPGRRAAPRTAPVLGSDGPVEVELEEEGELMDLFLCCQCSFYCVVSKVIPGVIPAQDVLEFEREKLQNPAVGRRGEEGVYLAWETIFTVIQNRLWKNEVRALPISRATFSNKVGWNEYSKRIFHTLGFVLQPLAGSDPNVISDALSPPPIDPSTPAGRASRAKLLRAWVEIGALLHEYRRRHMLVLAKPAPLSVETANARDDLQTALGSHPSQMPRNPGHEVFRSRRDLHQLIETLGLTAMSAAIDMLVFAYFAQCRCDPANTITYFSCLFFLVVAIQNAGDIPPEDLQSLVLEERGRNRFTNEEYQAAVATLGFGEHNDLHLDYDKDTEDSFVTYAWKDAMKRSWQDMAKGEERRRELQDAYRIIALARQSREMVKEEESFNAGQSMTGDAAYQILGVSADVDDGTLIAVFNMQVQDNPSQGDKMRDAIRTVANWTNSDRLRQFLETGMDPGDVVIPTRADLPRGLNQLGNTCYLNSLLQYFYTIKDLREAVSGVITAQGKPADDLKLSDDDLKRHRVGGRLVTRREILRSKKFVHLLGELFWNMEWAEVPAVTPEVELAKLALVTSKDEEEEDAERPGTDSSNDTDATLVEDAPRFEQSPRPASAPSRLSPSSVLGKRSRESSKDGDMEVDTTSSPTIKEQDFVMVSKPASPTLPSSNAVASSSRIADEDDKDSDVEMIPPPAEQRRPSAPTRKATTQPSDSVMMFGRQHDVSECMDNCMFQIETALLRFDELSGSEDGKTSVVKRLFYGKLRQRLTPVESLRRSRSSRPEVHEREDLFSHLPLNVSDEGFDLYDGLSGYFDDVVEYEGKQARMEVSLVDLPPVLQIQLQRVQFDREAMSAYKSQAYVKFGETITMDRFLDGADPNKKARSKTIQLELSSCRERIHALTKGKLAPFGPAVGRLPSFLAKLDVDVFPELDDELAFQVSSEQGFVDAELEGLRTHAAQLKQDLEEIWSNDQEAVYELTSVFIHRGNTPSWGHYFFYSRYLPDNPDVWFKYNDSEVTEVSKDVVFADTTGSNANPYLLVFARKGSEVVDTVKRFDPARLDDAA